MDDITKTGNYYCIRFMESCIQNHLQKLRNEIIKDGKQKDSAYVYDEYSGDEMAEFLRSAIDDLDEGLFRLARECMDLSRIFLEAGNMDLAKVMFIMHLVANLLSSLMSEFIDKSFEHFTETLQNLQ